VTDKEALELALVTLESDNLKIGNIYVNYDIQKALIKLVKKERKKKDWQGLTDEEIFEEYRQSYGDDGNLTDVYFARAIETKLKEKNAREGE
jgi:hypothetical protein